jgi:CRISPR type IV-associated protein Csf1
MKLSSSVVIGQALKLSPEGSPAKFKHECAMCGLEIEPGDSCSPLFLGSSFMDDVYMANRGSHKVCGWCARLLQIDGLRQSGFGAFGANGAFPFRKWADIAWNIQEPPEPPFVMVYATANNQHMGWRSPVNFSRDAFRVRVGLRDVLIRRKKLQEVIPACIALGKACGYPTGGKTLPNPFAFLSSDLKEPEHGRLRRMNKALEEGGETMREALDAVRGLTLGETWALRFILTPDAGKTSQPTDPKE